VQVAESDKSASNLARAWRTELELAMSSGRLSLGAAQTKVPGLLGDEVERGRIVRALDAMEHTTGASVLAALCTATVTEEDLRALRDYLDRLPASALPTPRRAPPQPDPGALEDALQVVLRWAKHPDDRVRRLSSMLSTMAAGGDGEAKAYIQSDLAALVTAADAGEPGPKGVLERLQLPIGAPVQPPHESPSWLREEAARTRVQIRRVFDHTLQTHTHEVDDETREALVRKLESKLSLPNDVSLITSFSARHPVRLQMIEFAYSQLQRGERSVEGMLARAERLETGKGFEPLRPPAPPLAQPPLSNPRPARHTPEAIDEAVRRDEFPTERAYATLNDELDRYRHLQDVPWLETDEDPRWEAFAQLEAFREERDKKDAPVLARLRELRVKWLEFMSRFPSILEYEQFMDAVVIPTYNDLALPTRLCIGCGRRFALLDGRAKNARFCGADDDRCKNAFNARAAARRRRARNLAERRSVLGQRTAAAQEHLNSCNECQPPDLCPRGRKLKEEALAAVRDVTAADQGDAWNRGERIPYDDAVAFDESDEGSQDDPGDEE
jgi:hypothetical protein